MEVAVCGGASADVDGDVGDGAADTSGGDARVIVIDGHRCAAAELLFKLVDGADVRVAARDIVITGAALDEVNLHAADLRCPPKVQYRFWLFSPAEVSVSPVSVKTPSPSKLTT